MPAQKLWTIGHGSRRAEDVVGLLEAHGITCLVDVRAFPRSKRHPQFSRLAFEGLLASHGIRYQWEGDALGGMRRPGPASPHLALTDAAFRGFADHMSSGTFELGVSRLQALAGAERVAFMCAEVMPQYCHRGFIADALVVAGIDVHHIVAAGDTRRHVLNAAARRAGRSLLYDRGEQLALGL